MYNTNYRAALDQISEYGTDDVRYLILFPFFPFTTDPNLTSSSRSSPTSAQPSNPNPTNVLFSKAIRKVPLRLFLPFLVSHYHHPRKKEKGMEMQSRRCFWWEIHLVSPGWNVMLIILERGVRGIRGGFWGFGEMEREGLRGGGWRGRGMFVFL